MEVLIMNRFLLTLISGIMLTLISNSALAKLLDLSGAYNCNGWDSTDGDFKNSQAQLKLQTNDKAPAGQKIQGYNLTIKNYGSEKDSYQGFAVTSDGVHMSAYFANTAPDKQTDYATVILTFHSEYGITSYTGSYYQPKFSDRKKAYDYGNVICKKIG